MFRLIPAIIRYSSEGMVVVLCKTDVIILESVSRLRTFMAFLSSTKKSLECHSK